MDIHDILPDVSKERLIAIALYSELTEAKRLAEESGKIKCDQLVMGIDKFEAIKKVMVDAFPNLKADGPMDLCGCRVVIDPAIISGNIYFGKDLITLN